MIGTLLHYNSAGSKAIGVVVDWFRYDRPDKDNPNRYIQFGDVVVALEWIKYDDKMPARIYPSRTWVPPGAPERDPAADLGYWPIGCEKKSWYKLKYFRIISTAPNKVVK